MAVCSICLILAAVAVALFYVFGPAATRRRIRETVVFIAALVSRTRPALLLAGVLLLGGCLPAPAPPRVRRLPAPPPEAPVCNLPASLHVRNWLGPQGQGSCVHASLKNHALWHNDFEFARSWPHSDGEYASRVRQRLDAAGIEYAYTEAGDPRFLDWCDRHRHGAILWWKPAHCCTFMGWVRKDGREFACILDNNYPGRFELTEREKFVRL